MKLSKIRILVGSCLFIQVALLVSGLNRMEFIGEDEISTSLISARAILGLITGNIYNIAAPFFSTHPPLRYLIQIPFQAILGIREWSMYLPHVVVSVLVFWMLWQIGKQFLDKPGLVILTLVYTASAAYAINRSPNAYGLFICLWLLAFYYSERYRQSCRRSDLVMMWLSILLATFTYLEGILFVPYLFAVSFFKQNRRNRLDTFFLLNGYILLLAAYFLASAIILKHPSAVLEHLILRQAAIQFPQNNLLRMFWNYFYTFSPWMALLFGASFAFLAIMWKKAPSVLWRLFAFTCLHLLVWLFVLNSECGHTLFVYPSFLLCGVYFLRKGYGLMRKMRYGYRIYTSILAGLVCVTLVYGYRIYTLPNSPKEIFGIRLKKEYLPCGLNYAHQIGFKSAAYLLRKNSSADELFVGDMGGSMNSFYLDRKEPEIGIAEVMLKLSDNSDEDIFHQYNIRFVGLMVESENYPAWSAQLNRHYSPYMVILRKDQQPSFVTWDVKDSLEITTRFVLIDEYAPAFDRDYQSIPVRFSRWREYRPSAFNQTNP